MSNTIHEGAARTATVTATSAGLTNGSADMVVLDATLDHIGLDPITGPKTAGVVFGAAAHAYNLADQLIQTYSATGTLSASGQAGNLTVSPTSVTFVGGIWNGSATISAVDPAAQLTLTSGGKSARSNAFVLQAGAGPHLTRGSGGAQQNPNRSLQTQPTTQDTTRLTPPRFN